MEISADTIRKLTSPRDKASAVNLKKLQKSFKKNPDLTLYLESSLSNQLAEKAAFTKLTDENALLKIRHNDMKMKYDKMDTEYKELKDEFEKLKRTVEDQKKQIQFLLQEIDDLKAAQGGDQKMKDMQDMLIRLSKEQERKDMMVYKMEQLLDARDEKIEPIPIQSSVCVIQ